MLSLRDVAITCVWATALLTAGGCQEPAPSAVSRAEQAGIPAAGSWGVFKMRRQQRSPHDVIARAWLLASIVLETPDLPSPSLLDPGEVEAWADAAAADPYREGALRFTLDGHDVLVRYRPASDRLTVSTFDSTKGPQGTFDEPGSVLDLEDAQILALECLEQLESVSITGEGEFSRVPYYTSARPTFIESHNEANGEPGTATMDRYSFVYHPALDGLPLLSAEVIVSVNTHSGRCQRITVSGQVALTRTHDAVIDLKSELVAQQHVEEFVLADSPVEVTGVHVHGDIGYYLPLTAAEAVAEPMYVAGYTIEAGAQDQPSLGRRQLVGLPLRDQPQTGLIELLGPSW